MFNNIKNKHFGVFFVVLICVSIVSYGQKKNVNRLDASIQRNRQLAVRLSQLQSTVHEQESKILNLEGTTNYYKSQIKEKSDSIAALRTLFESDMIKANYKIAELSDSLQAFREYREKVYKENLKIVKDSNILRVYDMPFDQVRLRSLRKVLEQGVDFVIEQNTDEGFVLSKLFLDRKSSSLFTKHITTKVEADIRMREHPFYNNKTLFYMDVKVQESKKKNKPLVEVTDPKIIDHYRKLMLKFFDETLIVSPS